MTVLDPSASAATERPVFPPAKIKRDPASFIRDERQQHDFASRQFKIPAAMRIGIPFRVTAAADKIFIRHADDIEIKIVERIAKSPFQSPVRIVGPIPRRRNGIVRIFQPPDRVEFVVEMDFRQVGLRRDMDAVPMDGVGVRRRKLHRSRLYFVNVSLGQRRDDADEKAECRQHEAGQICHSVGCLHRGKSGLKH